MKLVCHACKYDIATVVEGTKIPLKGAMFASKDEKHGFPAPWSPVITWENMFCPMCNRRPFIDPDAEGNILMNTSAGAVMVTKDGMENLTEEHDEKEIQGGNTGGDGPDGNEGSGKEGDEDVESSSGPVNPTTKEAVNDELTAKENKPLEEAPGVQSAPANIEAPAEAAEAKGSEDDGQGAAAPAAAPESAVLSGNEKFEALIKSGEIVQRGSWYEYGGKSHRKDELIGIIDAK